MPFKSLVRELDGSRNMPRRGGREGGTAEGTVAVHGHRGAQHPWPQELEQRQGRWANLPPELLLDVIRRVEGSEASWPARRHVLACAGVCRVWREIAKEVVKPPKQCGRITFPISLKLPGPREHPIQCYIKRERATLTFRLYLGLSPSVQGQSDKLLLAARKNRRATSIDYVISLIGTGFSRTSSTYIGKVRSNFLGTKFTVCDSQPSYDAAVSSSNRSNRRIHSEQVSPRVPAGNFNIATISYEPNVLRARGPRKFRCTMPSIPISSIQECGSVPAPSSFIHAIREKSSALPDAKGKKPVIDSCSTSLRESHAPAQTTKGEPLTLKNKAPRWHEQLQGWCLNFRGRVTVASVKNFQLVAAVNPSYNTSLAEHEKVILQFGKIGKDIFTMDYRYPLSAFQRFAICLTSFDAKPVCE